MSNKESKKQNLSFQAEVSKLLDLVANSLYSEREIFLRELISNAADACEKLRYLAIKKEGLLGNSKELSIRVRFSKKMKIIEIEDNGIGMDKKDLIDNLQSVNSLRVPSINEISKFKNIELSRSDIARKLEVNKLIQGSILISDDKASINLEFVDIDNGEILWNASLKIDLKKTLHIHNQVIDKILELVGIDMPDHLKKKFIIQSTDNPDAEREYKKARYLINIQNKKADLLIADKHLNKAIKHDPKYLFAHTQKAFIATKLGDYEKAEELLNFALDIAKQDGSSISNGYVYSILGYIYNSWSKNNHALKYNKLALQVYSHLDRPLTEASIMHNLGIPLLNLGKLEAALNYFKKSLEITQKYEDRPKQASSYAQIGNLYLTISNYTESIFYLNRSLAIFKDLGHSYNVGLSIIFITEAYIETGQIEKATELIKEAENILDEYKDPTIQGRLNNYKGMIAFYTSDMGGAITHIENSIQQYQSAQKPVPAFKGYLILLQLHIYNNQFDKAQVILKKIETLEKQIKDNKFIIRYVSINYLINTLKNKSDKDTGLGIIQQLSYEERDVDHYLSFWYLALAFTVLGEKNNAKKNLLQSQKLLKERSEQDSDKKNRKVILYTNPINKQIIDIDVDSLKDYTDLLIKEYDTVKVSKFCPDCGYSNIDLKSLCPECSNNLKI